MPSLRCQRLAAAPVAASSFFLSDFRHVAEGAVLRAALGQASRSFETVPASQSSRSTSRAFRSINIGSTMQRSPVKDYPRVLVKNPSWKLLV